MSSNFDYINLGVGLIALLSSIFANMKRSKCCYGAIDVVYKSGVLRKDSQETPDNSPAPNNEHSSVVLIPSEKTELLHSNPININKVEVKKNYL